MTILTCPICRLKFRNDKVTHGNLCPKRRWKNNKEMYIPNYCSQIIKPGPPHTHRLFQFHFIIPLSILATGAASATGLPSPLAACTTVVLNNHAYHLDPAQCSGAGAGPSAIQGPSATHAAQPAPLPPLQLYVLLFWTTMPTPCNPCTAQGWELDPDRVPH